MNLQDLPLRGSTGQSEGAKSKQKGIAETPCYSIMQFFLFIHGHHPSQYTENRENPINLCRKIFHISGGGV